MKLRTTEILYTVIFTLAFIVIRQCNNKGDFPSNGNVTIERDTTFITVKGKPDTIEFHDTVYKYVRLKPDTQYVVNDSVSRYSVVINDSLLEGEIQSAVVGKLLWNDFKYTPKFPKYITRVDTFKQTINIEKTITKDPWEFYIGGVVGGNSAKFNLQPAVLIRIPKKKLVVGYGYGIIDKTHNAHIYTKLWQ